MHKRNANRGGDVKKWKISEQRSVDALIYTTSVPLTMSVSLSKISLDGSLMILIIVLFILRPNVGVKLKRHFSHNWFDFPSGAFPTLL